MNVTQTAPVGKTTGEHTNFIGYTVVEGLSGEGFTFTVIAARAQCCEMCTDPGTPEEPNNCAAEYTIDAASVLGQGGNDVHYFQEHMRQVVEVFGPEYGGDVWSAPAEPEMNTAEVMARATGSVGGTYIVTHRDAETGELIIDSTETFAHGKRVAR